MQGPSIRARLLFCYSLSLALLLGVSLVAFVGIVSLDRATEALDRKWVGGARILGEMADLITEVRLGETHVSADATPAEVAEGVASANEHIEALAAARAEYATLDQTNEERALIKTFDDLWNAWRTEHAAWTALRPSK